MLVVFGCMLVVALLVVFVSGKGMSKNRISHIA